MVQWTSAHEIAKDSSIFHQITFAFFGAYIWEIFVTWDFEWSLLTGKRAFRWPLGDFLPAIHIRTVIDRYTVFFFLCRYCMLFSFIGLIISFSAMSKIDCQALYTFNSWTGNMSILCASTSLMLRTIALWERRRSIVILLGTLCVAHWALLYRTMFIVLASWDDTTNSCIVTQTSPSWLNTTFFFTMGFDFVITVCTAIALLSRHSARTDLWKLLFQDGLVYFVISFSTNSIPAIFNILDLNVPMNVIATVPAASITSIAACRAVLRLLEFRSCDMFVQSHCPGNGNETPGGPNMGRLRVQKMRPHAEVRVTTEHITMAEFTTSRACSPYTNDRRHTMSSIDHRSLQDIEALEEKTAHTSFPFPIGR